MTDFLPHAFRATAFRISTTCGLSACTFVALVKGGAAASKVAQAADVLATEFERKSEWYAARGHDAAVEDLLALAGLLRQAIWR